MVRRIDGRVAALAFGMACTCLLGWAFKAHCMADGWVAAIQYTSGCYSDAVPFWAMRHVDQGLIPYVETPMEYPVLTGLQIWIEGALARGLFGADATAATFLGAVTLVNALLAGLILWMCARAGMDRQRLWLWALAPPILLYLGHNWDLGATTLAVAAMLAARRQQLVLAAALAALGAAAKLFPVLLLPLIGLAALAAPDRDWRARIGTAATCTLVAIGTWTAVNLPVALAASENWSEFYRFSQERSGTAGSTWEILSNQGLWVTGIAERNLYASIAFLMGAAAIVGLGWRQHRDRLWVLFTPILAWFLLTNKVWSPQFDLWLTPLLVMTSPRLRPLALFFIGDIAAYFAEFWWFAGMSNAWPYATTHDIMLAASVRGVAMLWLIADAVRLPAPAWITRARG
ncbi:glycosyltransferase 87 family protein [Sphingomonas pituitosa]|uniref:glycosyltransferase 87 family protein n=1 Tax=Sphingomonas pituitosa TaxID=99597 RepID=UPI00083383EB|nr:glycosyltransferase 87 family protein [Sphingomonas pituitosa]